MSKDPIAELEREWKHASEVAFASIGQPDRAANVAWRDTLAAKLRQARAEARITDRRVIRDRSER